MISQAKSDTNWRPLYGAGSAAALITGVLIPLQIIVFVAWPPPLEGPVIDWFTLFQDNWLLVLLSLDLLLMVDYVLLVPIVLAFYVALRQTSESFMAIATALYFVAIAVYFTSNTAFEMLSQRRVRGCDNRCTARYIPGGGAGNARYLRGHCVSGRLRPRVRRGNNNRSCHATERYLQ